MLDEVTECFTAIAKAIAAEEKLLVVAPDVEIPRACLSAAGVNMANVILVTVPTNDTWARDFGPSRCCVTIALCSATSSLTRGD